MAKVCVLGHFGFGENLLNGQTIKTKIITSELRKALGSKEVISIDTHSGLKGLPKTISRLVKAFKQCDNIIIMPAHNGVRVFSPICLFFNKFFRKKLYYVVIGGWLPNFLSDKKSLAAVLKKFDGIYVETYTMKKALETKGFNNLFVLPNCKRLEIITEENLVYPEGVPYRLCTFSRVMKEKGIDTVVEVIKETNENLGYTAFSLDIYGQIQTEEKEWFETLTNKFPEYIRYCGCVDSDKSVEVLKSYFALLFPTNYYTEDVPGTIIDAYAAGIPVISARWESFDAIIDEGKTGIGYEFGDTEELKKILIEIANCPKKMLDMKSNCMKKAEDYKPDHVMKILTGNLSEGYDEYSLYPLKLCTFSRVMREKGIEDAVEVVEKANNDFGYKAFSLDIYGQIEESYRERFEQIRSNFPEYIRYAGVAAPDKSVDVLKKYFALLFPTYYQGEGVAGTLIDAYSAGVPVIASDWKYNKELVNPDVGYLYCTGKKEEFIKILKQIAVNPNLILSKKNFCIKEAEEYRIDNAIKVLVNAINDGNN